MEQQILDIEKPTVKIYQETSIWLAVFLGGPLIAGYILAENFKAFEEFGKVRTTWTVTILFTLVLFGGLILLPEDIKIPNHFIPIFYTGLASLLMQQYQGSRIKAHINSGGQVYGWGRVALVGFIGLLITIAVFIVVGVVTDIAGIM